VPSWCAVDHEAAETAQLFVLTDAPVIEALRLDRSEVLDDHQPVTGTWDG
jgi:gentisate 1,2-dioxygenase